MDSRIQAMTSFLDKAHSAFHAQLYTAQALEQAGCIRLAESTDWQLEPGKRYFVTRGGTAVIAFRIPRNTPKGFLIAAAHTDRPTFKIKENAESVGAYTRLLVERYGGQLLSTWADKPLSVAGRVMVQTPKGAKSVLVDIDKDLLLIPNVAIHMNREVNNNQKWDPVSDVIPLLGTKAQAGAFHKLLEDTVGGTVLGTDLTLYNRQKASVWGIGDEFLSAQALDDLACVFAGLQGFLDAKESEESIAVFCALDSEEVGSSSVQGADSTILRDVMERIADSLHLSLKPLISNSAMLSADNGHAIHPNHPELADKANAPVMGQGVLLKFNATLKYCTDGLCAALFRTVCQRARVSVQTYCNRADIAGGSTLGCISMHHVSIPTVDIGLPQLAMHSCYETAAVSDCLSLMDAMTEYFGSSLTLSDEGFTLN